MSGMLTIDAANIPPDHIAAIVARLRRFTPIMALCPDEGTGRGLVKRVSARLQVVTPPSEDWQGHAIVVAEAGGLGPDLCEPFDTPRVYCHCYGSTGLEAAKVARTVIAALEPVARRGYGFTEAGCAITDVHQVGGVAPRFDAENRAHVRTATFLVRKCQIAQVAS